MENFVKLSYESKKWEKWLLPNSKSSELEKAIISGHYIFSKEEFLEIKEKAKIDLQKKGVDLDSLLKISIKESILKYLYSFKLI